MKNTTKDFIPALRFNWLTAFYDPLVALTCREQCFKAKLISQANLSDTHTIVDLGSGTGTLAISIKRAFPGAYITGVDADEKIISIAQEKANTSGVAMQFKRCMADKTPFTDAQFDRCVSSLFFHHLTDQVKALSLKEAYRLLKPGGEIHIADWGKPSNPFMRCLVLVVQMIDGFETTRSNIRGELPSMMTKAGFVDATIREEVATPLGTITLYSAKKDRALAI